MNTNINDMQQYLDKWQKALRLQDWDIKLQIVNEDWHKTGDIKIDVCDKTAILLINAFNPEQSNLKLLIIHELLHLKLYGMDQMLEIQINAFYGDESCDPKKKVVYNDFMVLLESTVNDLAKSFLELSGDDKEISFGRLQKEVDKEFLR